MHHDDCVALFHAGALVTVTEGSRLDSTQFGGAKPSESGALPFNWYPSVESLSYGRASTQFKPPVMNPFLFYLTEPTERSSGFGRGRLDMCCFAGKLEIERTCGCLRNEDELLIIPRVESRFVSSAARGAGHNSQSHEASLETHSAGKMTRWSLCDPLTRPFARFTLKIMKRKNSTSLPRQAGYVKAGTVEKELKEIRKGLAWMRAEQKEMKRWIRDVLRNPGSLLRS